MELDLSDSNSANGPPRIQAEWTSKCAYCGDEINEGDWIVKDEDGNWIHEEHAQ